MYSLTEFSWLIDVVLLWIVVYIIFRLIKKYIKLDNVEIGPLYAFIKTSRLNNFLLDIVIKYEKALYVFYIVGVIVGLGLMCAAFYLLISNLIHYFLIAPGPEPPAKIIIPGVTVTGYVFLKMLPGILLVFIPHELSHKVTLHLSKVKIKSVGFAFVFLIPAAFVEPDENEFKAINPKRRLIVLAAGSYMNIIVALIFLPLVINPYLFHLLLSPFYAPSSGVIVSEILPNYPLSNQTILTEGDVIIEINGKPIKSVADLRSIRVLPGETVYIKFMNHSSHGICELSIVAAQDPKNPNRGILGYIPKNYYPPKFPFLPIYLPHIMYEVLFWIFFLSLNIGLINMLPIYMLDGYGCLSAILDLLNMKKKTKKIILILFSVISLFLVVLNLTAHIVLKIIQI